MVNDRNDEYQNEESEYQFTDDQVNYEVESEEVDKPVVQERTTTGPSFFVKYKRMLIGVGAFFGLLLVVYLFLTPSSSTTPPTEFSQVTPTPAVAPSAPKPLVPSVQATPPTQPVVAAQAQPTPPPQMVPTQPPQPPVVPMVEAAPVPTPVATQPVAVPAQALPASPTMTSTQTEAPVNAPPAAISQTVMPTETLPGPSNAPPNGAQDKNVLQRIAALEEQNAKLMAMLQTQNAKGPENIDENAMQDSKIAAVNRRLSQIETSINRMSQILLDQGPKPVSVRVTSPVPPPPVKIVNPKIMYTVQAIIPGRAWLKSENGETITVAEGDLLKEYGKVSKIDPYDGIVEIDNGSRIITLSYGASGE